MKVVILAGGFGTRLSEETELRPKPMVEIGGRPILWHIMKIYATYGFREFIIALGYKGEYIKNFFINYHQLHCNLTVCLRDGHVDVHDGEAEDWTVHLVDTGYKTETGGRLKRLANLIGPERFMMTYGDGVSNVNIADLLRFHEAQGRLATVTAVRPPARFGGMVLTNNHVAEFKEKPQIGEGWINGGFFVLEPQVLSYIENEAMEWEREPIENLVAENQLAAYRHPGFWHCMDTLRDVRSLQEMWQSGYREVMLPMSTWNGFENTGFPDYSHEGLSALIQIPCLAGLEESSILVTGATGFIGRESFSAHFRHTRASAFLIRAGLRATKIPCGFRDLSW
jgi:glucose-1-phosphate cytidylyltransferase